jgi:hypothetical protein
MNKTSDKALSKYTGHSTLYDRSTSLDNKECLKDGGSQIRVHEIEALVLCS